MASLINLEQERDLLIEQIMELAEATSLEEIEATDDDTSDLATEQSAADLLIAKFEELESSIATKVDAISAVVASQKGEIEYLKSRRAHFDRAIEVKAKALDRFQSYVKGIVESRGDTTLKGKSASIKIVKNGGKQPIWIDPEIKDKDFPAEMVTVVTTYKVDKEMLRQKIVSSNEENLVVDGKTIACLMPRGTHLRIG